MPIAKNFFPIFHPITVSRQLYNLTTVEQSVKQCRCDSFLSRCYQSFCKGVVGCNDKRCLFLKLIHQFEQQHDIFSFQGKECGIVNGQQLCLRDPFVSFHRMPGNIPCLQAGQKIFQRNHIRPVSVFHRLMDKPGGDIGLSCSGSPP